MTKFISSLLMITLAAPALAAGSGSAAPSYGTYVSPEASLRGAALEAEHRASSRITRDASGKVITTASMGARGGAPTSTGGGSVTTFIPAAPLSTSDSARLRGGG